MGINVYVIFNPEQYTEEKIINIIKEEGYEHNFFFHRKTISDKTIHMKVADEVWTFGNVEDLEDYKMAIEFGLDVWEMG